MPQDSHVRIARLVADLKKPSGKALSCFSNLGPPRWSRPIFSMSRSGDTPPPTSRPVLIKRSRQPPPKAAAFIAQHPRFHGGLSKKFTTREVFYFNVLKMLIVFNGTGFARWQTRLEYILVPLFKQLTAAAFGIAIANTASAAPIIWAAPVAITTADTTLGLYPSVAGAEAWGGGGTTVTLTSGQQIFFQNGTANGSDSFVSTTGSRGTTAGNAAGYGGSGNAAFDTVLGDFQYDGNQVLTLQNLVLGNAYTVQLFALDQRPCCRGNNQYYSDALGNQSASFQFVDNDYVLGTFTADAAFESITLFNTLGSSGGGGAPETNLNALVLYNTPEPASVLVFATMLTGIAAVTRRRAS